ncbi:hypothetical protein ACFX13_044942 [Malus domestica]|uniref:Uncharacterized protein n=1 Tax=Malus domestica TaxID=3750 RepID=A0A498JGU2_MALDO|nr:uncharacterized protein LOC108173925 [Malus domestica]XP_050158195.1 uncharacterized protein LOC126632020 [Malus sylvestris]RXH92621.1 hypothetical protein DVH24_033517 [Malus domestica]
MASESKKKNKAVYLCALLGMFAGVVFSSCFPMNFEEQLNSAHLTQGFVQIQDTVARRIQDGLIALPVKFLHFFLSRSLQFRHLSALQPPPFSTSMLFWVAFTRSVSSMSDDGPLYVIR